MSSNFYYPHFEGQIDKFQSYQYFNGKTLITEDVFTVDIFYNLISKIRHSNYLFLTSNDIKKLLPQQWNGKKYLKDNKNLHIFNVDFTIPFTHNFFTPQEIVQINQDMQKTDGFFMSKNLFQGYLFINNNLNNFMFINTISHQLIHYFQWNTGRSIYDINKEKQKIIGRTQDIQDINQIFNLTLTNLNSILNSHEYSSYALNIYYTIQQIAKRYNEDEKYSTQILLDILKNKYHNKQFKDYWKSCLDKYQLFYKQSKTVSHLLNNGQYILLLILCGFYEIGFNTIKNHLMSYYNKQ